MSGRLVNEESSLARDLREVPTELNVVGLTCDLAWTEGLI
jgi:hypothetical protein